MTDVIDNLIDEIERSYEELTQQLSDPELLADRSRYTAAARRHAELGEAHALALQYREAERGAADAEEMLAAAADEELDDEMRDYLQQELYKNRHLLDELAEEIRTQMLTRDPSDAKDVIIEIRAGTGGDEAALFAGDLYRMLMRYAEKKATRSRSCPSRNPSRAATRRSSSRCAARRLLDLQIRRRRAPCAARAGHRVAGPYPHLHGDRRGAARGRRRRGAHRPQRAAYRHLPLERSRRSVGRHDRLGGAHHAPAQRPRGELPGREDQLQNKEQALRILRARLFDLAQAEQDKELAAKRRSMVGTGDRSQKIRTYNYPQNRVTDGRIGLTSHRLTAILEGDLDEFTEGLAAEARRKQLASLAES